MSQMGEQSSFVRCVAVLTAVIVSSSCQTPDTSRGTADAPTVGQEVHPAIDSVFADVATGASPGYALGIFRDGEVSYARGYGMANLDHGVPISSSSVFNVASLSKQFTAAAVALLVLRGEVALDEEVRTYVPELPAAFGPIEVRHLVYMTSGLPEYYRLPRPGNRDWNSDHFTVADALDAVMASPEADFEPGTEWAYSNTNFQLLAEIVARVSGSSFADFLDDHVFAPLEMHSTHVNSDLGRVIPNRVTGYNHRDEGGFRQEIRRSPHYGGSGVFTTIDDLAKWDRALRTDGLAGPAFTELMLSTQRFEHDKDNDAFGLVWGDFNGRRTLWYEGGDLGFSSYFVLFPDEDLTVVVLSNLGTGRSFERANRVIDVLSRP